MSIDALCANPDPEGTFWRLARVLDPVAIGAWLEHERARGTTVEIQAQAMGDVLALLARSFEQATGSIIVKDKFEGALKRYDTHSRTGMILPAA